VALQGDIGAVLTTSVSLGIILGLFFGKQIGVLGFSWLAIKLGWAERPAGITWRHLYGVSLLTGIGFTMSLFIANLAFVDAAVLDAAKVGIFAASLLAGVLGWIILRSTSTPTAVEEPVSEARVEVAS
jgi:NhaA family Na+:H+ antiporter